MTDPSVWHVAE